MPVGISKLVYFLNHFKKKTKILAYNSSVNVMLTAVSSDDTETSLYWFAGAGFLLAGCLLASKSYSAKGLQEKIVQDFISEHKCNCSVQPLVNRLEQTNHYFNAHKGFGSSNRFQGAEREISEYTLWWLKNKYKVEIDSRINFGCRIDEGQDSGFNFSSDLYGELKTNLYHKEYVEAMEASEHNFEKVQTHLLRLFSDSENFNCVNFHLLPENTTVKVCFFYVTFHILACVFHNKAT